MRIATLLAALACVAVALLPTCAAAQNDARASSHRYFIDFRARITPPPTGHTYVVYWSENANGVVDEIQYVGLHPDGFVPTWVAGVALPVAATQLTIRRDVEERPLADYLIELSAAQFAFVKSRIATLRQTYPFWNLLVFNCNSFAGEIARSLGLNVPPSHLILPAVYIVALREMNNGRSFAVSRR